MILSGLSLRSARQAALSLLLAALTVAALGVVIDNDFIALDDGAYITRNSMVQGGFSARGVIDAFTTTRHGSIWHPLTWVSHMLDVEFFGLRPGPHHAVSLMIHTANALLLFSLLCSLTGALWKSALVAALFAVHPLHVESVAWASERKDVLSTFFVLCASIAYLRAARRNAVARSVTVPLLFALALMSKAMVVTLPFVFLLLDWWPLNRWLPSARRSAGGSGGAFNLLPPARLWVEKVPLFLLCAASAATTYVAQDAGGTVSSAIPAALRLSNACVSYVRYLGKTIWPQWLSPFYPYPFEGLPLATVAGAVTLLVLVTVVVTRQASRRPYLALGWLWFLGTLVPVIGLIQVGGQSMADRYTYVPLIGIFIAATWGLADLVVRRRSLARPAGALCVALLVALAAVSRVQAALWRDTSSLFTHALQADANNWVAWTALGKTLMEQGRREEAAEHFRRSLAISANYFDSNHNLGVTLAALERPHEALPFLRQAALLRQDDPINNHQLGRTLVKLGETLFESGKPEEAIAHLEMAVALDSANAVALNNLGAALAQTGRLEEAESAFRRALTLAGGSADTHLNLILVLMDRGKLEEAADELLEAYSRDPANAGITPALERLLGQRAGQESYARAVNRKPRPQGLPPLKGRSLGR